MQTKFETGATTEAVNNLVLFCDTTKQLTEIRDEIYMQAIKPADNDILKSHLSGWFGNGEIEGYAGTIDVRVKRILHMRFNRLFYESVAAYKKEFPNDHYQTRRNIGDNVISYDEQEEFCQLYANDFENWKKEHGF